MSADEIPSRSVRDAQVAHVLARAVRDGEVQAADALRILRHRLRLLNTNKATKIATRSRGAEAAIAKYAPEPVPKNGSGDALHADHVYPFTEEMLHQVDSVDRWTVELARLQTVVCVTAAENYKLERVEHGGVTGPEKYAQAGVEFVGDELPWPPTATEQQEAVDA